MFKNVLFILMITLITYVNASVLKTGQTTVYHNGDDGTYQSGVEHDYRRYTLIGIGDVVDDVTTNLTWTDFYIAQDDQINALSYCNNLGSGWRLPSIEELRTLVESNTTNSAFNPIFQEYHTNAHWTSTNYSANQSWYVPFNLSYEYYYYSGSTLDLWFKCVSDTSIVFEPARVFTRKDEVVYDSATDLSWQDDANVSQYSNKMYWTDAIDYCENLEFSGVSDWKLPNKNELLSITEMNSTSPAINASFQNTANDGYWASSTLDSNSSKHWQIDFEKGNGGWLEDNVDNRANVRCVREGEITDMSPVPIIMYLLD
jgi:hypothetical protein